MYEGNHIKLFYSYSLNVCFPSHDYKINSSFTSSAAGDAFCWWCFFFSPICLFVSHCSQLFLNFIASWGRPWTHSSPAALAYQLSRCWILPHLDSRCLSVLGASDSFSVSPLPPLLLLLMFFPLLNFIIFFISNIQEFL